MSHAFKILLFIGALAGITPSLQSTPWNKQEPTSLPTKTGLLIGGTILTYNTYLSYKKLAARELYRQHKKPIDCYPDTTYVYLFAHGLMDNPKQRAPYIAYGILPNNIACYAYAGPEVAGGRKLVSLGQEGDMEAVCNITHDIPEGKDLIAVGVSKGAATLINATGLKKTSPRALILESPFADMNSVIRDHYSARYTGLKWFGKSLLARIGGTLFPGHKLDGLQPIQTIAEIAPEVIVILFHSKEDSLISINESRRLYSKRVEALQQAGLPNTTYLIEAEHGEHAQVIWGNVENIRSIPRIIHAIMQMAQLPHHAHLLHNDLSLDPYQPTLQEIEKRIQETNASWL